MAAADVPEPSPFGAFGDTAAPAVPAPAIAEVYADQFKYVWRCLRALGVRDAALDDAVQDVFLVVQKKLEHFDGKAQLRTWLYAIALRVARRYRALAAHEARLRLADAATYEVDDPELLQRPEPLASQGEHVLECGERLELARRALDLLDDAKREVFVLSHVEQMSAPEIAETLGVPLNTVYSRLRAARVAFGVHVARLEPAPRRAR